MLPAPDSDHRPPISLDAEVRVADIVELALSLESLGVKPGDPVAFSISVLEDGQEVQRYPGYSAIETRVPTPQLEQRNWRA